jgi:hypothetical protein
MAKASDSAEVRTDEPWLVLTQALAALESQAVTRARELMATEMKPLKDRITAIESALKAAISVAKPSPNVATKATVKPVMQVQEKQLPLERPIDAPLPSSKKLLPPLPGRPSVSSLQKYLAGLGFQLVDDRDNGGGVWVFHGEAEFGHVAEHLQNHGIGVQRYPHGRRRKQGDQYAIDPYRVLPEK